MKVSRRKLLSLLLGAVFSRYGQARAREIALKGWSPAMLAQRYGARGTFSDLRLTSPRLIRYFSTQDGLRAPYVTRTDRAPIGRVKTARPSAQILDTVDHIEVHIGDGQSQRTVGRSGKDVELTGKGEPSRTAWLYQEINGDGRPTVCHGTLGPDGSATNIVDFCGLDFDLIDEAGEGGVSIDRVAAQTLQRLRDRSGAPVAPILAYCHGFGGASWAMLKPGSTPWEAGLAMTAAARSIAEIYGKKLRFRSVGITHDSGNSGDATPYKTALAEWVAAYDALGLNRHNDKSEAELLHFFFDQSAPHADGTIAHAAMLTFEFCLANPDRCHLTGPRYPWPVADGVHHTARGYLCQGEVEALAKHHVLDLNLKWRPCFITHAKRDGRTITLFVSPRMMGFGDLVVDTTTIEANRQLGFRLLRETDSADIPCDVEIAGDVITLTIAGPLPGPNVSIEVSYACRGEPVPTTLGHTSCWGNIKRAGPASVWRQDETIDAWLCVDVRHFLF
jgi:hypothetical protein